MAALSAEDIAPPSAVEEALVEVDVNQQEIDRTLLVLKAKDGTYLLAERDWPLFRLKRPDVPAYIHEGTSYYPLNALPGARVEFDDIRQRLVVTARPESFGRSIEGIPRTAAYGEALRPSPGVFVNYDLSASHATDVTQSSGVFEAGFFGHYGVLTSSLLAQRSDIQRGSTRLDTTLTADFPANLASLRLGDSINRAGAWGRVVRFGGIQYGTNFGTQPGFVTFPLQAAAGQATLPSVVDVFVNNALVAQRAVPPGPFSLENVPIVTGPGTVNLVVRDILGREQIFTQSFYGSSVLLKPGLSDYSFEAGVVRDDFGVESNDYGPAFASATYRRGFTDRLTGEARAEATRVQQDAGVAATVLYPRLGVFDGALALGRGRDGTGVFSMAGFERQSSPLSFGVRSQWASGGFRQIGSTPQFVLLRQISTSLGVQLGRFGSTSLTYVAQRFRDQPDIEFASLGYSMSIDRWAQLNVAAVKSFGAGGSMSIMTTVTVPFGARTTASLGHERTRATGEAAGSAHSNVFTLDRSLPPGEGYGYRLAVRDQDVQASVSAQNNLATSTVEAARFQGQGAVRATVSGGLAYLGGHAFLSREITGSFGVVQVADYPGVRVLLENQVAGRTNAQGFAVLPQLRPYDLNSIAIEQRDLPLDAEVERLKLDAVPYFRSGVLVRFPVTRVRAGTLHIVLDDGTAMPAGALARIDGRPEEFPVAMNGELYLTGFERANRVRLRWKDGSCVVDVTYPETTDPLPELGTFVCKGVRP